MHGCGELERNIFHQRKYAVHSIILLFYNLQQRRLCAGWRLLLQLCWLLMLLLVLILPAGLLAVRYHLDPNGSSMLLWMELLQCLSIVATVVMCSWWIDRRQLWTLGFSRTPPARPPVAT